MKPMKQPSRVASVVAGIVSVLLQAGLPALARQSPFDTIEFRDAVQAVVYHHERAALTDMLLRYEAEEPLWPDLQIVFEPPSAGVSCHVEFWSSPSDAETFGAQYSRIADRAPSSSTAADVARQIKMTHIAKEIPCAGSFARLLAEGWRLQLPLAGDESLSVHGGAYYLEMSSPSKRMNVSLNGPRTGGGRSADPIYRWMERVRLAAAEQLRPGPGTAAR
jgi:hypothetical protein